MTSNKGVIVLELQNPGFLWAVYSDTKKDKRREKWIL